MNELPKKEPTLRVPALVKDSNPTGTMFGGWLMGKIDIAGSIPAIVHAQGHVVTASINNMTFLSPLYAGDLLSLYADIVSTGQTSMVVKVEAWIQRIATDPACLKVSEAELVYVAIDKTGHKRQLPNSD